MQNFKKYGVAAAVASISVSSLATVKVSTRDAGDAAIVPYYTTQGDRMTGVHIVNTTNAAQAVKVRFRRAKDSADAMDFNIVMSPYDEWTGYVKKDAEKGIIVGTSDNTCTVPVDLVTDGVAAFPSINAEGAEEGYIEIIGMGQAAKTSPAAVAATHVKGTPKDCAAVQRNFYRVTNDQANAAAAATVFPGVHSLSVTSQNDVASCTTAKITAGDAGAVAGAATAACSAGSVSTTWADTADNALKVSYFIREGTSTESGLEVGANAVHLEGFSDGFYGAATGGPLMTNQVQLLFDADKGSLLEWDPMNFEFPNLGQAVGNTGATTAARMRASATHASIQTANETHFNELRAALNASTVVNEWADNANASADWVVTLPGQYAMTDAVCARYAAETDLECATTASNKTVLDANQLPLYLIKAGVSQVSIFDREELVIAEKKVQANPGISFSPSSTDSEAKVSSYLENEVNVLVWGTEDGGVLGSDNAVTISTLDNTEGWASLSITPKATSSKGMHIGAENEQGASIQVAVRATSQSNCGDATATTATQCGQDQYLDSFAAVNTDVPVAGLAIWKREFASNASANYGRAIEHSLAASSGATSSSYY